MLTKDHLKYRVKGGRVYPSFVSATDAVLRRLAADLLSLFEGAQGMRFGELEETAAALGEGSSHKEAALAAALTKLLLDSCDEEEDDGAFEDFRWRCFEAAETLRRSGEVTTSEAFQAQLAEAVATKNLRSAPLSSFGDLSEHLYGDLPARRSVKNFKAVSPETLLWRYNCAQVQGLLLQARSVEIKISDSRLAERRELFRQLRFHRLLAEVLPSANKEQCVFRLGGPLSIFDQQATYGSRLASFFPHLLYLESWELTAEVKVKGKLWELRLDQKSGLRSHYKQRTPYIPAELTAFMDQFNERCQRWRVAPAEDFVHLGMESYCFPDMTISNHLGEKKHVELFHRWHASPLLGRLQALERFAVPELFLGVSKVLMKEPEVSDALKNSRHFAKQGFIFTQFPTPRSLMTLLVKP